MKRRSFLKTLAAAIPLGVLTSRVQCEVPNKTAMPTPVRKTEGDICLIPMDDITGMLHWTPYKNPLELSYYDISYNGEPAFGWCHNYIIDNIRHHTTHVIPVLKDGTRLTSYYPMLFHD